MAQPISARHIRKLSLSEVFRNIYPWRNINDFVDTIKETIAYKSEDGAMVAINKPFGVGTYTAKDLNTGKTNQDRALYQLAGSPKYCLQDALEPLTQELGSKTPFVILKSIDRYLSGLVLITNDIDKVRPRFLASLAASRNAKQPAFGFRAITSGYPLVSNKKIFERVGLEMIEVDEFGDYKEPVIVQNPSKSFRTKDDTTVFQVELEVKRINKEYSASLLELYVSKLAHDFARCYISSKTSFILGDVRFSKRIREILGTQIQVSAFKSSHIYDDSYEPLNSKLRDHLGVHKNASIPLMLDLHALRLKGFDRKQKRDLLIQSPSMPLHFALTAHRLNLLDSMSSSSSDSSSSSRSSSVGSSSDSSNKCV